MVSTLSHMSRNVVATKTNNFFEHYQSERQTERCDKMVRSDEKKTFLTSIKKGAKIGKTLSSILSHSELGKGRKNKPRNSVAFKQASEDKIVEVGAKT